MEQVLIGGIYNPLHTGNTEYSIVVGKSPWSTYKDEQAQVISTSGKLKNLRVELNDTPGGGSKTYKFTLHRAVGIGAWANTALTCTVSSGDIQASDMVNEISVAAGDVVILECDPTDTPTARYAKWSMVFEGDNANESLLLFHSVAQSGLTYYCRPIGRVYQANEDLVKCVCPTSGVIKNLYVQIEADPGTSPDAYRYTLRIDGANKALTVTITADDRTGNNTADNIAVSAGDVLTVMMEPLNSPSLSYAYTALGMTFVADTDGESLILGGSLHSLNISTPFYNELISDNASAWVTTESERYQLSQVCVLKKFYMLLSGTPGSGKKYTFTLRKNETSPASGLVVEIADAATAGNDTANSVTLVNDDELTLMCVPDGTPTSRKAEGWGLVSYIAPPVVGWAGGDVLGVDIATIAKINGVLLADIIKVNGVA